MSTKACIAAIDTDTWLEEEMVDETVWLVCKPVVELRTNHLGAFLELQLSPAVLDAIVKAHAEFRFPHQRQQKEDWP